MNVKQLGILNSLVTYAAENVPGGLSEEEQEVAQIVGSWVISGESKAYMPVFAGKTMDYRKIVIYKDLTNPEQFHMKIEDGELQALGPDSTLKTWTDKEYPDAYLYLSIESPQWTGTARGSRVELLEAEAL